MKIEVLLTDRMGKGPCQSIGVYDDWSDIKLHVGMFWEDCVITFNVKEDDKE